MEVRAAALNHLDIWVRRGGRAKFAMPHVLGSDGAGVVAEVGEARRVRGVSAGEEVVINPGLSCGRCESCLRGEQSYCEHFGIIGMARPGTFAQYVAVPAASLAPEAGAPGLRAGGGLGLAT